MEVLLPLLLILPSSAGAMIGVSLALSILIVSIMFMLAYAFSNPQMVAMAREELAALAFTIIILWFWFGSDFILNNITSDMISATLSSNLQSLAQITPNPEGLSYSHITLAIASLDVIKEKLLDQYKDLFLFEALIGFLSTISFPLGSPVPAVNVISFSLSPFTGLTLLSNAHTVVVEAIGYLLTVVWAKEFILIFSRDIVPLLLFPMGLVMRAVPFFRKTGSSIIAVCFSLFFVLPMTVILSNFLIFDIFQPADFSYTPVQSSYFGTQQNLNYFQGNINTASNGPNTQNILSQFSGPSVVQTEESTVGDDCYGNSVIELLCSVKNMGSTAIQKAGAFIGSIWNIWRFMVGFTGDFFFTAFNNPLMPASASAGLFYFLINEVLTISPFIILVTLTTVIEIIITVTTYRSISQAIGGEAELIGLTKVV